MKRQKPTRLQKLTCNGRFASYRCPTSDQRSYRRSESGARPLVRQLVPAQPVDATPSSALIQQRFCRRTTCLASRGQIVARAALLLVYPWQAILPIVFNAGRVLA